MKGVCQRCIVHRWHTERTLGKQGGLGLFYPRPPRRASEPRGQVPLFPMGAVRLAVVVAAQE